MAVISAKLSIGEVECVLGVRYSQSSPIGNERRSPARVVRMPSDASYREVPTVRDFVVSPGERLATAISSAAIVRDVAALCAMVLFGTMLVLVLSSADFFV